jgi:hypothetical protein
MKKFSMFGVAATCFLFLFCLNPALSAKGKIEFGFHYGSWSINPVKGLIESALSDAMETEFKDKFMEEIRKDNPGFQEKSYTQKVSFDSGGSNFGFELRWYPGGENGSFSMGFSVEKTSMKISLPEVSAALVVEDSLTHKTGSFSGNVNGDFSIKPLSFHLSFRWDIVPSARVHPYFTLGFGMAGGSALEDGTLSYSYVGDLTTPDETEHYADSATKTLKQLKEETESEIDEETGEAKKFPLPGFVPFIQLHFGLKLKIANEVHALIDYGIFDGFLLRGGLALRF